jgi:hypothetical protein
MNKIFTFCVALFLAGCSATQPIQLVRTELQVVEIPERFRGMCPEVSRLPNASTLTDRQVADLLARLWQGNRNCRTAVLGIYEHNRLAKTNLENAPIR